MDLRDRNRSPRTCVSTELFKTQMCLYHQQGGCRWGSGGEKWAKHTIAGEISWGDFKGCQKYF